MNRSRRCSVVLFAECGSYQQVW